MAGEIDIKEVKKMWEKLFEMKQGSYLEQLLAYKHEKGFSGQEVTESIVDDVVESVEDDVFESL